MQRNPLESHVRAAASCTRAVAGSCNLHVAVAKWPKKNKVEKIEKWKRKIRDMPRDLWLPQLT